MQLLPASTRLVYSALANAVFAVHLAIVLLVSVGWLIPGLFYAYLAAFFATLVSELAFKNCPLTRLEFGLRKKLDPAKIYDTSCIAHYGRALFGKGPRPAAPEIPKTFLKRYSFLMILCALFAASMIFHFAIAA